MKIYYTLYKDREEEEILDVGSVCKYLSKAYNMLGESDQSESYLENAIKKIK